MNRIQSMFKIGKTRKEAGNDPRVTSRVQAGVTPDTIIGAKIGTVLDLDSLDNADDFTILGSPVPFVLRGDVRAASTRLEGFGNVTNSLTGDGALTLAPVAGRRIQGIGVWLRWAFPLTGALPAQLQLQVVGTGDGDSSINFTTRVKPATFNGGALIVPGIYEPTTGLPVVQLPTLFASNPVVINILGGVAAANYTAVLVSRGTTQFSSLYSSLNQK